MERRQTGRRKIEYKGDDGDTHTIYETRQTPLEQVIRIIGGLLTIAGVAFAVVRFGINYRVEEGIKEELQPPAGIIYTGIESEVHKHRAADQEQIIRIDERQIAIQEDISEIKTAVKEIAENGGGG